MDEAGERFDHKGTTRDGRNLKQIISDKEANEFQNQSAQKSSTNEPVTDDESKVIYEKVLTSGSPWFRYENMWLSMFQDKEPNVVKVVQTGKKTSVASSKLKNLSTSKDLAPEKKKATTTKKEKLASDKAGEIFDSQESSNIPAVPKVQNDPGSLRSLKDVKVIMNEHSRLALQQLRDGLQELLRPLEKIEELRAMVEQLQADLQSLDSRVALLRQNLDDGLDQIKECINHKAQPVKQ